MRNIILASQSKRRKKLLEREGIAFEVVPANIDENHYFSDSTSIKDIVMLVATEKAMKVAHKYKEHFIIGADTVVLIGSKILGKPVSRDHALYMLQLLSGKKHNVITGVTILYSKTMETVSTFDNTGVIFKPLSLKEIDNYLDKIDYSDKAGSYGIQEYGELLIDKIEGNVDNVIGLPVKRTIELLNNFKPNVD